MRRAFGLLVLLSLIPVSRAFAQTTVTYEARVASATGPLAAAFTPGERMTVTYTLDESAPDQEPFPTAGFFDAVLSVSVYFPESGLFAAAGPLGFAQTFNNLTDVRGQVSDQFSIHGGAMTGGSLGGVPIVSLDVSFISEFLTAPAQPTMLLSDALPLSHLTTPTASVSMLTGSGYAVVQFTAEPPRSTTCTVSPMYRDGTLTMDFTLGTTTEAEWHVALLAFGNVFTLFKAPLPATEPVRFPVPLPGFPAVGRIGVMSTLTTGAGLTCNDLTMVDTGTPADAVWKRWRTR